MRTKLCVRKTVYEQVIGKDIIQLISNCKICKSFSITQPVEPLLKHEITDQSWVKIGAGLFLFNNKDYVIVVDYASKFLEVSRLPNTEASTVINNDSNNNNNNNNNNDNNNNNNNNNNSFIHTEKGFKKSFVI